MKRIIIVLALVLGGMFLVAPADATTSNDCHSESIFPGTDPTICIAATWSDQADGTGMVTTNLSVNVYYTGSLSHPNLKDVDISITANNSSGYSSNNNTVDPSLSRGVNVKAPGHKMTLTVAYTLNINNGGDRRITQTITYGTAA